MAWLSCWAGLVYSVVSASFVSLVDIYGDEKEVGHVVFILRVVYSGVRRYVIILYNNLHNHASV